MEINKHIYRIKGALTKEECNQIITDFENNKNKGYGPNNEYCFNNETHFYEFIHADASKSIFTNSLVKGLFEYADKYPFLKRKHWGIRDDCKLQKYLPGESYSVEHCEHENNPNSCYLILAWMFYLNDVIKDGGGTFFPQQNIILTPRAGDLIIWPSFWTHSHKGLSSEKSTKYIATGWCTYYTKEQILERKKESQINQKV